MPQKFIGKLFKLTWGRVRADVCDEVCQRNQLHVISTDTALSFAGECTRGGYHNLNGVACHWRMNIDFKVSSNPGFP